MPKPASRRADHAHPLSSSKPAANRKLRFLGSLDALQDLVLLTGVYGDWEEKPNGIWRYVCEDRGGLNWSSTKGTLWFDGPEEPRARLQRTLDAALRRRTKRPC